MELSALSEKLLAEHGIADSDIGSADLAKKALALSTPAPDAGGHAVPRSIPFAQPVTAVFRLQ
ncbi:hypothetical protein ACFFTM_21440 [Pseudoduganella plicata]|uniref:Uncharacterized protein n=1 Tax=Pseudoduganella plicata TaxID=321984 RepID=A0A4P7BGZ5_9BURK|nr:hypothetical protein [Pseudoduganella plicata]QBQ38066.1 hypothetical protein E1742_19150 [Pseudoduganella plicata]GGZ03289.1 hypothetical protein GCM10007388_41150 [Pseudoduganella plicata]